MLSEANIEISHAVRRAEQYENEVKRLRARVEELKKEMSFDQEESSSAFRRLLDSSDEYRFVAILIFFTRNSSKLLTLIQSGTAAGS